MRTSAGARDRPPRRRAGGLWTACARWQHRPGPLPVRPGRALPPRGAPTCASASPATAPSASTTPTTWPPCEAAGAELVPIDTLHDSRLPAIDGLFIGGGFPEACMDALEANAALRAALRAAIEAGLPTYAECGGLMYLSRSITWQGRRRNGGRHSRRRRDARPRRSAAATCTCRKPRRCPGRRWRGTDARPRIPPLEPATTSTRTCAFAYRVRRGHGIDGAHDGVVLHHLLASYTHLRSAAGTYWAPRFVDFVRSPACRPQCLPRRSPRECRS